MMHICTVATLCFPEKTVPRNYYYCVQDDNSLCLCFKSMYRTLFVAIFTSTFIFSMYDHILVCLDAFSHTYRNINISNLYVNKAVSVVRGPSISSDYSHRGAPLSLWYYNCPTPLLLYMCVHIQTIWTDMLIWVFQLHIYPCDRRFHHNKNGMKIMGLVLRSCLDPS